MPKYKRILLKLSGEALAGENNFGFSAKALDQYVKEVKQVADQGVQVGIVLGGGNIFRGLQGTQKGFSRIRGDYMGMLATVINALAFEDKLEEAGQKAVVLTSTFMEPYAQRYTRQRAIDALENGYVTIFAGGTGNPFFTTDSAAALKAIEINADVLVKGTNVDGVYSDDPKKNPNAQRYETISFSQVLEQQLRVMDLTAFTLCRENNMPIIVFDIHTPGNLLKIINGEQVGTLIF